MTSDHFDRLTRLRESVYDLQEKVEQTPPQARPAVEDAILSSRGVEYATHVVERLTNNVENITRQHCEQGETSSVP